MFFLNYFFFFLKPKAEPIDRNNAPKILVIVVLATPVGGRSSSVDSTVKSGVSTVTVSLILFDMSVSTGVSVSSNVTPPPVDKSVSLDVSESSDLFVSS